MLKMPLPDFIRRVAWRGLPISTPDPILSSDDANCVLLFFDNPHFAKYRSMGTIVPLNLMFPNLRYLNLWL